MLKIDAGVFRKSIKVLQVLFFVLCFVFVLRLYFDSREQITKVIAGADLVYLLASIFSWSVVNTISPLLSCVVLRCQGGYISYSFLLNIFFRRLPAKYLPGGIWHTVARFHDLAKGGVGKKQLAVLVFYENFWSTWMAALIAGAGVYYFNTDSYWGLVGQIVFAASLCIVLLSFWFKSTGFIFSGRCYLRLALTGSLFWLFASASFYFYISAFDLMDPDSEVVQLFINYMFAWLVGFATIFAPQGVGVFEIVVVQTSQFVVSASEAVVIVAGFRLIVFGSDVLSYLLAVLLSRGR